jgi:hypothetical protein
LHGLHDRPVVPMMAPGQLPVCRHDRLWFQRVGVSTPSARSSCSTPASPQEGIVHDDVAGEENVVSLDEERRVTLVWVGPTSRKRTRYRQSSVKFLLGDRGRTASGIFQISAVAGDRPENICTICMLPCSNSASGRWS